ncbi:MAG: DUF975 family protein [Lentisphaeria bacterium]|nr:DUF975 family protein [Lentisphaeria bacterium]
MEKRSNKALMAQARVKLEGKWGLWALVSLVYILVLSGVSQVFPFASLFITGAFGVGLAAVALNTYHGKTIEVGQVFDGFKCYVTSLVAYLLMGIYLFLWSLLWLIPFFIGFFALAVTVETSASPIGAIVYIVMLILIPFMMIPFIRLSYSYSLTYFVIAEKPEQSASESLRESVRLMDGNRWKVFCLSFRFIGWIFLALFFTLGIGMLWVSAYMQVSIAEFYKDLSPTIENLDDCEEAAEVSEAGIEEEVKVLELEEEPEVFNPKSDK